MNSSPRCLRWSLFDRYSTSQPVMLAKLPFVALTCSTDEGKTVLGLIGSYIYLEKWNVSIISWLSAFLNLEVFSRLFWCNWVSGKIYESNEHHDSPKHDRPKKVYRLNTVKRWANRAESNPVPPFLENVNSTARFWHRFPPTALSAWTKRVSKK